MVDLLSVIEEEVSSIDRVLEEKDRVREQAIKVSRDVLRLASDVITYVHNREFDRARSTLSELKKSVEQLLNLVLPHEELRHAGFVNNALAEYVEATLFYTYVIEGRIPKVNELNVHYVPYLLGLCDFVGELRRFMMDLIRERNFDKAFEVLKFMEGIYEVVRKLDYPDALVPGLRHKVDVMRRLVDDTKMFLLDMESRNKLSEFLRRALELLSQSRGV